MLSSHVRNFVSCVLIFAPNWIAGTTMAASIHGDAFASCMQRTKHERSNCNSGCGMILRQCYDEAVSDLNTKSDALLAEIRKRGSYCTAIAEDYSKASSQWTESLRYKTESRPGWLSDELVLHFAQQRLSTFQLLSERCK
ncbi:hypothetical protein AWB71_01666 [Caballeronia peredens]|nr:hypothetical protein AWB71_01666 [Caballeronia peredens]